MKVYQKHSNITKNMHGASRNYRYVLDVSGSIVDGDESGGTSPSRHSGNTGILVPRSLFAMAAEIGIASGEKGSRIRVSATGE